MLVLVHIGEATIFTPDRLFADGEAGVRHQKPRLPGLRRPWLLHHRHLLHGPRLGCWISYFGEK